MEHVVTNGLRGVNAPSSLQKPGTLSSIFLCKFHQSEFSLGSFERVTCYRCNWPYMWLGHGSQPADHQVVFCGPQLHL